MANNWNAQHRVNLNGRYTTPNLPLYTFIQTFLTTENFVIAALNAIDNATQGINTHAGFETWLSNRETAFGFNANVITIQAGAQGNLSASQFLSYLAAKRPMLDFGAGPRHGANTHRVQWVMIGMLAENQPNLFTESVVELYRQLGGSGTTCRVIDAIAMQFEYLWDDLCDRLFTQPNPTYNATCPEYLREIYVEISYPRLATIWR